MSVLRDFLLAFADDEHLIGQHHTEWIGTAPFLEEDLAFSSIGQDELGHAALLYELVLDVDGVPSDDLAIDQLAFFRSADAYRSSALAEYSTTDWAEALVRHWIYDAAEQLRWANVASSSHQGLAETAARAQREEVYHRLHADSLLDALLGAAEARERIHSALDRLLPLAPSVLAAVHDEADLVSAGVIVQRTDQLVDEFASVIEARFSRSVALIAPGAGRAERSASFVPLMARMREVFDLDPAAIW